MTRFIRFIFPLAMIACLAFLFTGCSFNRAWKKAGRTPPPADDIAGRWEGTWLSEASGHNDRLRAIITPTTNGMYETRFHAKYKKILGFRYTVILDVTRTNNLFRFTGQEDLGVLAGGVYRYDGYASPTHFVANYHSKYDRGIFQMTRPGDAPKEPLAGTTQLIVVTTKNWDTVNGTLRRFTRVNPDAKWTPGGEDVPIVVGRKGMAWGRGLHGFAPAAGPVKREGDGKSPAGVFRLSSAFGYASRSELEFVSLPYRQIVPGLECVDDSNSAFYNQIVERARVDRVDWNSSEKMIEYGEEYRLGITVDHNTGPRLSGFGSCIFLHIWKNSTTGTSGCTAMTGAQVESLLRWLDPKNNPALVQLPEAEYKSLRKQWQLPDISK